MDFPMDLDLDVEPTPLLQVLGEATPEDTAADDDSDVQKKYKMMLSVWLSFCIVGFVWFITKVLKGRQRIRTNFSSIEEQLRRMQAVIEERERAMAENGGEESEQPAAANTCNGDAPKVSPDAQKLLETLTKAFGKADSEETLEKLEESEETCAEESEDNIAVEEGTEDHEDVEDPENNENNVNNEDIKWNNGGLMKKMADDVCEASGQSRRRKGNDSQHALDVEQDLERPLDVENVELLRDTIEHIIQEGVQEVQEPSKKDN